MQHKPSMEQYELMKMEISSRVAKLNYYEDS